MEINLCTMPLQVLPGNWKGSTENFLYFRESAGKCLDLDCLSQEERDRFYSLGDQLGYLGLDMQLKQMDLMEKETEYAIRELRKDFCEKRKLYRSMGILGGIFVAVFFW